MKFSANQIELQKSLNYCQGVIEKRSTLPILSNILLDVSNSRLTITATDLDLIFIHKIDNIEVQEEGKTTTTSSFSNINFELGIITLFFLTIAPILTSSGRFESLIDLLTNSDVSKIFASKNSY